MVGNGLDQKQMLSAVYKKFALLKGKQQFLTSENIITSIRCLVTRDGFEIHDVQYEFFQTLQTQYLFLKNIKYKT